MAALRKIEPDPAGGSKVWVDGGFDKPVHVEETDAEIRRAINGDDL